MRISMKHNAKLLEILRDTKHRGLDPDRIGICDSIPEHLSHWLERLFPSWQHFSGYLSFPIVIHERATPRNITQLAAVQYYWAQDLYLWDDINTYLGLRWSLLLHCIEALEERLNIK